MRKKLNISKTLITVILLNVLQLITVIGVVVYSINIEHNPVVMASLDSRNILFITIVLTSILNSFFTINDTLNYSYKFSEYQMLKESLEKVESLNQTLRAQRHDFMNHLQVVYSLMELGEYYDARDYIERVYTDIQKVNRVLKTSNSAINALLQAKVLDADKRGITTILNVTSQFTDLPIPSWEMCRVLGNLIDNAFDALTQISSEKQLEIFLFEDLKHYGFKIKNKGPRIHEKLLSNIFEAGFTTKCDKGEGMGLAIVKDIIIRYKGLIRVESTEELTVFEGLIPKNNKSS